MPRTAITLRVTGVVLAESDGTMLALSGRIDGHDTFLTGQLQLDGQPSIGVRILTLDDVTVLHLIDPSSTPSISETWAGVLHLPHGWRTRDIPDDLAAAAKRADRDLSTLDTAELRYALTFLEEATTNQIRLGRIEAIVNALPALPGARA